MILASFCVDDCLARADTLDDAQILHQQLYFLLQEVGLTLRKWRSNSTQLLDTIPEELREKSPDVISTDPTAYGKTLGLHWNTETDVFHIAVPALTDSVPTNRSIASAAAKLYDIMGWFGPVSLYVKILLQQLWESKLVWDDPIPAEHYSTWQSWVKEVPANSQHPVPNESKGSIGRELGIDSVVHKHVSNSSYVNWCSFITFFRTNFIDLTARSQIPPKCGVLVGENFHLRSYLLTNISIPSEDLSSLYICCSSMRSVLEPIKFDPLSDVISAGIPRRAENL